MVQTMTRPLSRLQGTQAKNDGVFDQNLANQQILFELRALKYKMNKIDKIEESQIILSEKFDEFNNEIKILTKLEHAVEKIKHENNMLKNQVAELGQQITQLEKNLTSTQVLIENIPAKSNENLLSHKYQITWE
jgi:predicted RNase H-like nuclease (RuvC/YqgF family)